MGTPESNLISSAKNGFKKNRIRMIRLEVISEIGVPDAFYSMEDLPGGGFIEFKRIRDWPKRPSTVVKVKHFSQEQRAWMMLNGPWIERVFLHLQIGRDHMLFPWPVIDDVGTLVKDDLIALAQEFDAHWCPHVNYAEYKEIIRSSYVTS